MSTSTPKFWVRIAIVIGSICISVPSRADGPPGPELQAARQALARYDRGGGTRDVIADLTGLVARTDGADQREARFLRAVAATDLFMLSFGPGDRAMQHRDLGEALGMHDAVTSETLTAFLDGELANLEVGCYEEAARDSRWVLRALHEGDHDPELLRAGQGLRRDILFVHAVVDAVGAENELEMLARYGAPSEVEGPFAAFSDGGRRAISALREASEAMARLEVAAASGEPLTASLAGIVEVDGAILRSTSIQPSVRFPAPDAVHAVGERGGLASPDVIFWVEGRQLHYGFTPSVRVVGATVEVVGSGRPTLPEFATIAIPDDGRSALMPFEDLSAALGQVTSGGHFTTIGLAAGSEVEAFTISRVLVTMERVHWPTPVLLARGEEGEVRGLPISLTSTVPEGPSGPPNAFEVFVRLGGYTVQRGPVSHTLPRVRENGRLRFDFQALETLVDRAAPPDASLRFMSGAPWGSVMDAGFRLELAAGHRVRFQLF